MVRAPCPSRETAVAICPPYSAVRGILAVALALLWQIYSRCFSLQIHFLQRGHRCGGGRAMSSRMGWRTAGNVCRGGVPLILFFPPCCFKPAILEESVGDHRHERMTVKALPGSALEVIETKFFFQLLVSLLANPSCRHRKRRRVAGGEGHQQSG